MSAGYARCLLQRQPARWTRGRNETENNFRERTPILIPHYVVSPSDLRFKHRLLHLIFETKGMPEASYPPHQQT